MTIKIWNSVRGKHWKRITKQNQESICKIQLAKGLAINDSGQVIFPCVIPSACSWAVITCNTSGLTRNVYIISHITWKVNQNTKAEVDGVKVLNLVIGLGVL